jgi:hypothetical protein
MSDKCYKVFVKDGKIYMVEAEKIIRDLDTTIPRICFVKNDTVIAEFYIEKIIGWGEVS